jgi:hypothetical protein
MLASHYLVLHIEKLRPHPFSHRLPPQKKPPSPRPAANVRQPEKVEGFRLCLPVPLPPLGRISAELDEARLVWMQFQFELPQSIAKVFLEPLSVLPVFESHHGIVGEACDDHVAARVLLTP